MADDDPTPDHPPTGDPADDDRLGGTSSPTDADRAEAVESAPTARPRSRRPVVLGITLVVAAAVAALAILLGRSDDGTYDDEVRAEFLAACTRDAEADGLDATEVCGCLYDGIVEQIPYERYESVNAALAAELEADPDAEVRLPDDFDEIRSSCVEEAGLEPATTTTAAPDAPADGGTGGAPDTTAPAGDTTLPPGDTTAPAGEASAERSSS